MIHSIKQRALHTAQNTRKSILYGWGQTQALPLSKGHMDRVLRQPTRLDKEDDYALPVSDRLHTSSRPEIS